MKKIFLLLFKFGLINTDKLKMNLFFVILFFVFFQTTGIFAQTSLLEEINSNPEIDSLDMKVMLKNLAELRDLKKDILFLDLPYLYKGIDNFLNKIGDIPEIKNYYKTKYPNSCEALYYNLDEEIDYKDIIDLKKFKDENIPELLKTYYRTLNLFINDTTVTNEWENRIKNTDININKHSYRNIGEITWINGSGPSLNIIDTMLNVEIKEFIPLKDAKPKLNYGSYDSSLSEAVFIISHELSHLMNWAPTNVQSCLAESSSIEAKTYSLDSLPSNINGVSSYEAADKGFGTQYYHTFDYLTLKEAQSELARLFLMNKLPVQLAEAIADFWATIVTTEYIKTKYSSAEDRKKAALLVLRHCRSEFFKPEWEEIYNKISSKKTNTKRVFGIMLSNKEFRNLLGCKFAEQKNVYTDCSDLVSPLIPKNVCVGSDYCDSFNENMKKQIKPKIFQVEKVIN